jgi:hypothetical protein
LQRHVPIVDARVGQVIARRFDADRYRQLQETILSQSAGRA